MSNNLPSGTTHADIDKHFGSPGTKVASGSVDVGVDIEVPGHMDDDEIEDELADAVREALDMDDDRIIEVVNVHIGEVYDR